MKNEIKTIDPTQTSFEANGKTYYRETMTVARWRVWLKLHVKLGYGLTFDELFHKFKQIYTVCNKSEPEPGMACVLSYNTMERIKDIGGDERIPETLAICALFWNQKDEDRSIITDEMIAEKVKDWEAEAIDAGFFLTYALSTIPNFIPIYKSISQNTSQKTEQEKESEAETE